MGKIKTYLIDTNCLLEFVGRVLPVNAHIFVERAINDNFNVSVINHLEVLGHPLATKELGEFMDMANTHQLTEDVVKQTIEIRKQKNIKLPDAIIAATALVHGLTIISRNTKDFQNITSLSYLNPYDL